VSRNDVEACLSVINDILQAPQLLFREMQNHSFWNLEQYLAFHYKRKGLQERIRLFPYVMFTVRGLRDGTRWAEGQYEAVVNKIVKYETELKAALLWHEVIRTVADWETVDWRSSECLKNVSVRQPHLLLRARYKLLRRKHQLACRVYQWLVKAKSRRRADEHHGT